MLIYCLLIGRIQTAFRQDVSMQFRERSRVIQIIRTVYDPAIKRGKSELVGRIDRDRLEIEPAVRIACSGGEVMEIEAFLDQYRHRLSCDTARQAAESLPGQMRLAETWFRDHADIDIEAGACAAEVWTAWKDLAKALRKVSGDKAKHRDITLTSGNLIKTKKKKTAVPQGGQDG
jgi:hypothetical protein